MGSERDGISFVINGEKEIQVQDEVTKWISMDSK